MGGKKPTIPKYVDLIVRETFQLHQYSPYTFDRLEEITGIAENTMRQYKYGRRQPNIGMLRIILNALGYDLIIVKINKKRFKH